MLHNLAYAVLHRGDCAQALGLFNEGLAIQYEMGNQAGIAECLAGIASVMIAQGKAQQGAQLLSASAALREASGSAWWPADRIEYEHSLALLHQSLSERALAAAWDEGWSRSWEEVVADVLPINAQPFPRSHSVNCSLNAGDRTMENELTGLNLLRPAVMSLPLT